MKKIKFLFSSEMFFVLFLTSGIFKQSLNLSIDITIVFLALSILSSLKNVIVSPKLHRYKLMPIIVYILLVMMALVSVTYSLSHDYAISKTIRFMFITTPAFLIPFFIVKNEESVRRIFLSFTLIGTVLASIVVIKNYTSGGISFIGFNEGNYLGLGQLLGVGFILSLSFYMIHLNSKWKKTLTLLNLLLLASVLLQIGARMPLIAVILIFIYYALTSIRIKNGVIFLRKGFKWMVTLMVVVTFLITYLIRKGSMDLMLTRLSALFQDDGGGASAMARLDRYRVAIEQWSNSPFIGSGFGSFGVAYNGIDARDYPHNIFLELLSEIGFIGFSAFVILTIIAVFRIYQGYKMKSSLSLPLFCVLIYLLINANVSGSINDQRILFSLLALACILPLLKNKDIHKGNELA